MNLGALSAALAMLGFKKGGGGGDGIESIQAGSNISINNADPKNPVISATGGGGGFRGLVVRHATDQPGFPFPYLPLPTDKQVDTDNAFDVTTGIYTVPAGVTMIRFQAAWLGAQFAATVNVGLSIALLDVDSNVQILGSQGAYPRPTGSYDPTIAHSTPYFSVTPGQRLRFRLNSNDPAYNLVRAGSTYTIEVLQS